MERWGPDPGIIEEFQLSETRSIWYTDKANLPACPIRPHSATRGISVDFKTLISGNLFSDFDYVAFADHVVEKKSAIFLWGVPKFKSVDVMGSARRFGKFVEIFYDKKIELYILADAPSEELFSEIMETETSLDEEGAKKLGMELSAGSTIGEAKEAAKRAISRLRQLKSV